MKASLTVSRDPFRPALNREQAIIRRRRRIRALAPLTAQPHICLLNGRPLLRAEWRRRVNDGDIVNFIVIPQGGDGGSNPMQMVLMMAVLAFAPEFAAQIGAGLEAAGMPIETAAAIGGSKLTIAAVTMGGTAMVNALCPPPKPSAAQTAAALAMPSPTYNIQGQGNVARIDAPIPAFYGRMMMYPDFGALPYTEYAGNEQYLYQLLVIGQGEYSIESIRIADTVIESSVVQDGAVHVTSGPFQEISYQVVAPGGTVTLFPANVISSTSVVGQEALTSTTLGPFAASPAGTVANVIGIDVVFSRGLYLANFDGSLSSKTVAWMVEGQLIDDYGVGYGSWIAFGTETYTAATSTPQRVSYRYNTPSSGRWQIRFTRTDTKDTSTSAAHELDWASLRAYLPGSQIYGNVTLLAMRMRATNNLSSISSRKINVIATRKLPTWNGSIWSAPVATRSIAWAFADACRAQYGGALPDSRIALAQLLALDATWTARGDHYDCVHDQQSTIGEALTQIARAGRAIWFMQGGVVNIVRDQAQTLPTAMFTMRNIIANSLKLTYLPQTEETVDSVVVKYFDSQIWGWRTATATLPGSTCLKPATVTLNGVTDRSHAWREGMYMAASNKYRRRTVVHQTEMEGFSPAIGDLTAISHDMPFWGQSGEIVGWDAASKTATTSEPLDWSAGGNYYFAMRKRDGSVAGPFLAQGDAFHAVLADWNPMTDIMPDTGGLDRERTYYAFGPGSAMYVTGRVLAIKPRNEREVEISTIVESDYVHIADTGSAPGQGAWQLPSAITAPVVAGLTVRSMPSDPTMMILSWQPAPGADHYIIEQSGDGNNWSRVGDTSANNYTARVAYGAATLIRVAAVGITRGSFVSVSYGSAASYMWNANPATLMWSSDSNTMWRY